MPSADCVDKPEANEAAGMAFAIAALTNEYAEVTNEYAEMVFAIAEITNGCSEMAFAIATVTNESSTQSRGAIAPKSASPHGD